MNKTYIKKEIVNCLPYGYVKKHIEFKPYFGKEATEQPELYNKYGERMNVFYLQDKGCAHTPYTTAAGRFPRTILWDRFNKGLPIHFHTHSEIFEKRHSCKKRFATLRESEAILPDDFDMAMKRPEIIREYDTLFTYSERLLDRYSNAEFVPAGSVWYATELNGGSMDSEAYLKKEKNISIVSSAKVMCELHKVRIGIARHFINDQRVDTYGAAVGNYIEKKADALEKYRYSIAIENDVTSLYFTEKILDCFASMTVPIYIGATRIGDYFNMDGIIQVRPEQYDSIDQIVSKCCIEDYIERREAIIDNFNRVQEYLCLEDYLMKHHKNKFELG